MRLYLIRHAQTAWNVLEKAQGHTDIELDETGWQQAQRLAAAFCGTEVDRIWSSDLKRSADCARALVETTSGQLRLDPRLRERGMGDWEGMLYSEFNRNLRDAAEPDDPHLMRTVPPGGESLHHVWERLRTVSTELFESAEDTVVVTHGGACSLLLAQLLRANIETSRSFRFANAGITELHKRLDGLFNLVRYNDARHLDGSAILSGNLDGVSR